MVKAVSEQGVRLNIRKATLREWRRDFARHLGDPGIAANATERAVRGDPRTRRTRWCQLQRAPRGSLLKLMNSQTNDRTHNAEVEGSSPSLTTNHAD